MPEEIHQKPRRGSTSRPAIRRATAAVAVALIAVGAVCASEALASPQSYAVAPRDITPVDMRSSCTAEAAVDVNRGAAFLLALAPREARRAFERAADTDPDCAMAGWGRAMSWVPIDPWRLTPQARREGLDAVRRAGATTGAGGSRTTPRERAYVASAAAIFDQPADMTVTVRLRRHLEATHDLANRFQDDAVATILFARATLLMSTMPDDDFQREAATIIERRFGETVGPPAPEQLGAALTLLMARDRPTAPHLARPAADIVARLATLPLARHLPARTYTRLGDWAAAVASTEAAIKLAGSAVSAELVYGPDDREVAAEWLVEAYLQQGRFARATTLIGDVRRAVEAAAAQDLGPEQSDARAATRAALVRMQVRHVLMRTDWARGREADAEAISCDGARGLDAAAAGGATAVACMFVQAFSAARMAWPGAKPEPLADAARLSEMIGGTSRGGQASVPELLRVLVRAAMAAGQEEHPELELLASYAIELEERLLRFGQLVLPLAPAQELIGDLFLQANRFAQARLRYLDSLMWWPNRPRVRLGLARAAVRLGDREAAAKEYTQFLELWSQADPDLPELTEARTWLQTHARPPAP